jgi:hypothetical protein
LSKTGLSVAYPAASTHGKIRTFNLHVLSVTPLPIGLHGHKALSTRFELAIFSVTGRRELQASPREHRVGDDRIELPSSRCKRDVMPFHQSPEAARVGVEPTRLSLVCFQNKCRRGHQLTRISVGPACLAKQRRVESDHRLLVQSQSRCHYATSQQSSPSQSRTVSFRFKGVDAAITPRGSAP